MPSSLINHPNYRKWLWDWTAKMFSKNHILAHNAKKNVVVHLNYCLEYEIDEPDFG